ncbi:flagellar protein FliS [Qipengyuania qiaonensis]|uniref:Flagellar protein FliS n=1 Tax=Qipengyuania qiaonensis TaxID=2867240 RepID=A0ABS7JA77_9SPHN|nr:flagellar protein FliS [Qipengyuania qiaonensis]MBX7481887.1 flagellar protein FliS [Qipengyuania qiaonensis]
MLSRSKPNEAYRQASFDARLLGSSRDDLVIFCLEDFIENLGRLELADARCDSVGRSRAITRCVTALTALELGIDRKAELGASLAHLYGSAKKVLLNSIRTTDVANIAVIKSDFSEIASAFRGAMHN